MDRILDFENLKNEISALNFTIPVEIFSALDILTHCVGYIMPFRLYTPLITLILGYWLLLISIKAFKAAYEFTSYVFSVIPMFFGKK